MSNWEKEARRIFKPYAQELEFDEGDWSVFLARISQLLSRQREEMVGQIKKLADKSRKYFSYREMSSEVKRAYDRGINQASNKIKNFNKG